MARFRLAAAFAAGLAVGAAAATGASFVLDGWPAGPPAGDDVRQATVTRVVDGDTVHLDGASHRLVLVDTPERGEPGFDEATEFVKVRCLDRQVAYDQNDPQPTDRFGRHLSLVYCDGPEMPSINELLIREGHSGQYTRFCSESEFADQAWAGCRAEAAG